MRMCMLVFAMCMYVCVFGALCVYVFVCLLVRAFVCVLVLLFDYLFV